MLQHFFGIFIIISFAKRLEAVEQCPASTHSAYGHSLSGHGILTHMASSLTECIVMCSNEARCKSLNFRMNDKSCELNNADRHTHPEDYGPKERSIYMDTSEKHKKGGFNSCAEVHQEFPQAESGYYWIKVGNREAQVYCDMENYGGGWTLVVSISSKNNDHLQRNSNNCLNSILCVPFAKRDATAGRKLSDGEIHKLAKTEGTFRVDVWKRNDTIFYQIPSGAEYFNSTCHRGDCPRIIISHSYPYEWETNTCTTIDVGYHIMAGCHRVFDGHDDGECTQGNSYWRSKHYDAGRRALYGYPCPQIPQHDSLGIYRNSGGMLFVK